ncbi:MAG: PAS domain-containing protein [Lentisphaerae bacterium]|nr:PAS domain-containing protein [Lentisphaerota bacterium]
MKRKGTSTRGPRPPTTAAPTEAAGPRPGAAFPIVGIGASAGGLEALEQFLGNIPPHSGMAFVIIQHLDPTRKGLMPELLQRTTGMKIIQVKDRTRVQPDSVYVIPPNKDMSILHGMLHLLEPAAPRGLRLPIDFFLRSLALDQQEHSIGVILSGMGSDGTLGLRAIKEKGGLILVQDPATAKFDGMPRSAIEAGLPDIVAPVAELPAKLIAYLRRPPLRESASEAPLEVKTQSALEKVVILLRARTGNDFSLYKRNTLHRRIERRMGIHQIGKMATYIRYLQENTQELDLLFKELLIGVTNFFRDPAAWDLLRKDLIPALIASRPTAQTFRAWVTGCSTGEEAYSLAMVFKEAAESIDPKRHVPLQIFATDLDRDAIELARRGVFPANIAVDVSPERLAQFFTKDEHGYRVRKEIRDMITFAPQNLIMDPPFTKLDILCCRNLLIYLEPEMQKKLIPLFHYNLSAGGILFLGSAETVGGFSDLFAPVPGKSRLYRRMESATRLEPVEFPSTFSAPIPGGPTRLPAPIASASLQSLADQLVLQRYAPPAALVNDKGDIFYISGRTGKYLEPAAGKANWNIFVMVREGLRYELSGAFQKVLRQDTPVTFRGRESENNPPEQAVDVTIQRLAEPGPLHGLVMIVFADVTLPVLPRLSGRLPKSGPQPPRLAALEHELHKAHEETRITRAEMQLSQEELKSTNEEMQSTNEELQSTNEELMTSKEEMQSLNEELQTVNTELQAKLDELSRSNNDMKNLLNSTDIATLFLDNDLNVRRYTTQATKIIKLRPGDVGRPITDLASQLHYPHLVEDGRAVLQSLVPAEKPIGAADGRWFTVRIMPYRTLDDRIDGLVITFMDITTAKAMADELGDRHASLEKRYARQTFKTKQTRTRSDGPTPGRPLRTTPAGRKPGPGKARPS